MELMPDKKPTQRRPKGRPTTIFMQQRFQFHPGRLRQSCVAVWAVVTIFGLYQLLGLTGLALGAAYVTNGIRQNRRNRLLQLLLQDDGMVGPQQADSAQAASPGSPASALKPLLGSPLRCWICPWCVGIADQKGRMHWVFNDEVAASDFAKIRRRVLLAGYNPE